MGENEIGSIVVDCSVKIHRDLGPGLLETVCEVILAGALEEKGLKVQRQAPMPIEYEGRSFMEGFRADMVVDGKVLLELKSVESPRTRTAAGLVSEQGEGMKVKGHPARHDQTTRPEWPCQCAWHEHELIR